MSGKKHHPPLRNTALTDALQTQDIAAVAFALRHGPTAVPIADGDIWTYSDPNSGEAALLLFSDAAHKPKTVPAELSQQSPKQLSDYLTQHRTDIATVIFDFAGPHPMRATPADLLAVLEA